jgi:hypothetical protein
LNFDALAPIGMPESVEVSGSERTIFLFDVQAMAKDVGLTVESDATEADITTARIISAWPVGVPTFRSVRE